jgi:hypothetical protein
MGGDCASNLLSMGVPARVRDVFYLAVMARRAGNPPWPITLSPNGRTDADLHEVVVHIRRSGFAGLCGVDPNDTIDMSIRAKNPQAARARAESLLEPDFVSVFTSVSVRCE